MKPRFLFSSCLMALLLTPTARAGGTEHICRAALDQARESSSEARPLAEVLARYEALEEHCLRSAISPDLRLEALAESAEARWVYGKDFAGALEIYEKALAEAGAHLPGSDPVRIQLIEGLARALHSLWSQGRTEAPDANLPRIVALYQQAHELNVRRYGATSPEAARALLNLSNLELEERPDVAEAYARQALEARRQVCGLWGLDVSVALQYLADALGHQGKHHEQDEIELLLAKVKLNGQDCPAGCCDDR
ncbi:MAG TPA: hypothetical protein VHQ65_06505 [Thermoanaerobaculia bacterium]|nr:hypothetical protein [Thermoanaerobaculia bacterium]